MIRYSGATYGYGRVYREYPQAQLQQQGQKPLTAVTQPTSALQLPPWAVEAQDWAALGFVKPAVYLVRLGWLPPAGPPVAFPSLGQWIPRQMDPPDPRAIWTQFRLPVTPPPLPPAPIAFPLLGQWTPTTQPLDESYYSFRLRLLPVGPPPLPLVAPWATELVNFAALGGVTEVVYLVRAGWLAPVVPTPALFARQQPPFPTTPFAAAYYAFRLPHGVIVVPLAHIWVRDASAGLWRSSTLVAVYDASAATWRVAVGIWVYDAAAGVWRKAV